MHEGIAKIIYRAAARARGESTFRFLEEYRKTQWKTRTGWEAYREERLENLYRYASRCIPFYQNRPGAGVRDFPVIVRTTIKEKGPMFVNPDIRKGVSIKKTSGSTGEPVIVRRDAEGLAREQAVTWRGYEWAGLRPGARQARFWGVPMDWRARLAAQFKDILLNRKRFSVFNYSEPMLETYAVQMERFLPTFIYGYASALYDFAIFLRARHRPLRISNLRAVVATSEVLTEEMRSGIEEAFGVPVFNEYGCSELGTIAHQCPLGKLHINAETLYLEVLREDGMISEEGQGRIIVTEFHNLVQPLIRYDLGDVAVLERGECVCGRAMPIIREIQGKSYDIIFGPAGRKYFPEFFSYIFKDIQSHKDRIRQFQVIQTDRDLVVNMVRGRDFGEDVERDFQNRVRREFGDFFKCTFNYMQHIPKENSGKFRQVKRLKPVEPYPFT